MSKNIFLLTTTILIIVLANYTLAKELTELKVKQSYTVKSSDYGFKSEIKRLNPLLSHLHSKKISGPITVIYERPYTTQDSTTIPTPPVTPQIGTVRTTEFCSGNSRVQLTEEFRYTADVNGDGANDSDPQWVTTGFKEIAQESAVCKSLDL